ncbi:MAG: YdcF family protein [Opitutales bacterium]|nr:YdcF family protein [Opitutales bacterium]
MNPKNLFSRKGLKKMLKWSVRVYVAGTLVFFALFLAIAYTPLGYKLEELQIESTPFEELWDDAEAVVILGGDSQRAADAVKVFNAGKARRVIVSADERAMLDVLLGAKIPAEKISVDTKPLRTIDHPRTILEHGITPETKIIITSTRLQERRAARLFREAGYTNFQVYSQTHEVRFPEKVEKEISEGQFGALDIFYSYLAWLKYWLVD